MNAVIYHNPKCGTSRNTLALIRFAGIEPEVIDYLANPDALLDAMLAHPILINRPLVQTDRDARLCRPSEVVLEILPPLPGPFRKEDGELVIGHAEGSTP